MTQIAEALAHALGADRVRRAVSLAPMTTFRVGGAAEWFVETRTSDELVRVVRAAHAIGLRVMIG